MGLLQRFFCSETRVAPAGPGEVSALSVDRAVWQAQAAETDSARSKGWIPPRVFSHFNLT